MNRLKVQQWAEMSAVNYDYLFSKKGHETSGVGSFIIGH